MKHLHEFQQRVVDEASELQAKTERLQAFIDGKIFAALLPDEQERLRRQAKAMAEYLAVLHERIDAF
jgi:hypothetical protein